MGGKKKDAKIASQKTEYTRLKIVKVTKCYYYKGNKLRVKWIKEIID